MPFQLKSFIGLFFLSSLVFVVSGFAAAPPMKLMTGELAMAPAPRETPTGPPLGIMAQSFRSGNINGVIITQDRKRRDLWYLERGVKKRAKFAPGRDVILKINDNPVRSAKDVLRCTIKDFNKLRIKDRQTGVTGDYWIDLAPGRS